MNEEQIRKKFPAYMDSIELPTCAKEQEIIVYRACRTRRIEKESFLNTYEENGYQILAHPSLEENDPQHFSMSTYVKVKELKRFCSTNQKKYQPPYLLAKGITKGCCGVSCLTSEWKKKKGSHVDWWLYENATPWEYFVEVNYDEECSIPSK